VVIAGYVVESLHLHYRLVHEEQICLPGSRPGKSNHPLKCRVGLQDIAFQIQQLDAERRRFKNGAKPFFACLESLFRRPAFFDFFAQRLKQPAVFYRQGSAVGHIGQKGLILGSIRFPAAIPEQANRATAAPAGNWNNNSFECLFGYSQRTQARCGFVAPQRGSTSVRQIIIYNA
jgi:hypothetical protein